MEFTLKTTFNASAEKIYRSWLSSEGHSAMTRGEATVSDQVGDEFTAWDGYITGKNLMLVEPNTIVQSWRTTEFADHEEDSQIEIQLEKKDGITELTLIHTKVPENGEQYIQGWENHYWQPMRDYFEKEQA